MVKLVNYPDKEEQHAVQTLVLTTAGEAVAGKTFMSRTDVHRPWKVQVEDPYNRHLIHRYGPEWYQVYYDIRTCGCELCTEQEGRKAANRRRRHRWQQTAVEISKARKSDIDLIEALPDPHDVW